MPHDVRRIDEEIRGQSHKEVAAKAHKRAFLDARSGAFDGWSKEDLDELTRRTLLGPEEELRQALAESNAHREERRRERDG